MNEVSYLVSLRKSSIKYNILLDYSMIKEDHSLFEFDKYIIRLKDKIKQTQFDVQLQINLSKNGILCQDNCNQLMQIIKSIFNQGEEINLKLKIDMKKILEAGGIHYYLEKQIDLFNKYFQIRNFSLYFTEELFNSQCIGVISKALNQIENIELFDLKSEIKIDHTYILQFPTSNLKQIKLEFYDPEPKNLFFKIIEMENLVYLNISLFSCDVLVQEEILQFINKTKIKEISICLQFKEQFLLKKDLFYNSLSNFIKQLNLKRIKLINYHIDLSQLEDSGLKQDILQELNTQLFSSSLIKLTFIFNLETQIKTLLISFLYKISDLILKLENLESLVLKFNIDQKYQDILQKCLNQSLWRLKEFVFENTCERNKGLLIEVEQEENCKLQRVTGIKIKNKLYKMKYLTSYKEREQSQNKIQKQQISSNISQKYLFSKRKLIQQIYALKANVNFKRKEILEQLLVQLVD